MNTSSKRVKSLIKYVKGIQNNEKGAELYLKYKEDIQQVKPQEAFEIFHSLLQKGTEPKEILLFLDRIINVFYKSLSTYSWEKPENDNFLLDLMLENKALIEKTDYIKEILKEESFVGKKEKLLPKIQELQEINHHYLKKENILFPYLEKEMQKFEGLSIMWALHEEVKNRIKEVVELLKNLQSDEKQVNEAIGKLFFAILGVVKKEDLILFPAASEVLKSEDWYKMHKQSLEYDFSFIERKIVKPEDLKEESVGLMELHKEEYQFKTETGSLDFQQMLLMLNALPVDLTFVDEKDKVRFFTRPKDRIFPRSPAIIGREVKNCHPPDSVHIVEEIVESFRSNQKDQATFWIELKGKMIFIQYFALRDEKRKYRGTLEVSQDVTEIRKLEGQKRILDWK